MPSCGTDVLSDAGFGSRAGLSYRFGRSTARELFIPDSATAGMNNPGDDPMPSGRPVQQSTHFRWG